MKKYEIDEEYNQFLPKFETFQGWINGDLKKSSYLAHANFLVAMGIFNYIEILGSFFRYKRKYKFGKKESSYSARFNFAVDQLFTKKYKNEFIKIRRIFKNEPYDIFRSGMTHEYLVKTYTGKHNVQVRFTVVGVNTKAEYDQCVQVEECGIKVIRKNDKFYQINIYNPKLIDDLDKACNEYKNRLKNDKQNYKLFFIKRCQDINFRQLPPFPAD